MPALWRRHAPGRRRPGPGRGREDPTPELDADNPDEKRPRFHRLDAPTDDDIARLLAKVARRVVALLRRRGRLDEEPTEPPDAHKLTLAAAAGRPKWSSFEPRPRALCAHLEGFSLDAQVAVHEHDRAGLERLAQYVLRSPLAAPRLSPTEDDRLRYRMKRTFSDGTSEVVLTRHELLARLCALVPPPRPGSSDTRADRPGSTASGPPR